MLDLKDLIELEKKATQRGIPIIGAEKGAWLLEFVTRNKPQRVLELGSANGYSGIILGSCGAELITVEINAREAEEARGNFADFDVNAQVVIDDGSRVVKKMVRAKETFDLVFIDFAKKKYMEVLDDCIRLTQKGGYIIADNITMEKCADFTKAVLNHPKLTTEIISIGDGMSCSRIL